MVIDRGSDERKSAKNKTPFQEGDEMKERAKREGEKRRPTRGDYAGRR
jgi:hypothetical protein